MKLTSLYDEISDVFKNQILKHQDPNLPELLGQPTEPGEYGQPSQPSRSGNQNTPMKPRHRRYFNSYTNKPSIDKGGYPDQSWSNPKKLTPSNTWIRPYSLNSEH